ncbi:unnamed protein product [Rangifer tarandus platyrhynchus]|uniref:Uncharacterized protein n=2 Tax=Rangifer tarandus platyrhynchus TaxID=3082113 RepID=A0AC60A597_RANTA|nr:unnamed protein product [Rangifer tarandus platyrhynchus]
MQLVLENWLAWEKNDTPGVRSTVCEDKGEQTQGCFPETPSQNCDKKDYLEIYFKYSSVQSFSCVPLCATPWTAARQASLSITNSPGLFKFVPIESVMPSSHLILCCPLLLPPSIVPSIRVFSNESVLHIR